MKHPLKIAVLISGRGSNLEAILRSVAEDSLPVEVALVLSDKKDAQGLEIAARHGVPTLVVPRRAKEQTLVEFNQQIRDALRAVAPDLVVLAGYMRILGDAVIDAFPNRIINIHPSLLPSFPGLEAQRQALDAGVRFSGCTVHFVVGEVDAGPIIAQACVPVLPSDTEESLSARILSEEHLLYSAALRKIANGEVRLAEGKVLAPQPSSDQIRSLRSMN